MGSFVAREAEDFLVACGDPTGDGLAGGGDFDFAGPFFREVGTCEGCDGVFLEGSGAAECDALLEDI